MDKAAYNIENNPDYLICGRSDKQPACSDPSIDKKYHTRADTRVAGELEKNHDANLKLLACPDYYEPVKHIVNFPLGFGQISNVRTDGKYAGILHTYGYLNTKPQRYMRVCKRKQYTKIEDKLACCDDNIYEDNKDYPRKQSLSQTIQNYFFLSKRSMCPSNLTPNSSDCEKLREQYCLQIDNMGNSYCVRWFNDPKHPERLALRDEFMKTYCTTHQDDPQCSCFYHGDITQQVKLPYCFDQRCIDKGYKTQMMQRALEHGACPDIMDCRQYMGLSDDAKNNIISDINMNQYCSAEGGGTKPDKPNEDAEDESGNTPFNPDDEDQTDTNIHNGGTNTGADTSGELFPYDDAGDAINEITEDIRNIKDKTLFGIPMYYIFLFIILVLVLAILSNTLSGKQNDSIRPISLV